MTEHKVGTREEYQVARAELLEREKELTHRSDELAHERRLGLQQGAPGQLPTPTGQRLFDESAEKVGEIP